MTALLITALLLWPQPSFNARFGAMLPSINLETYRAARRAAARPSFCQWDYPGTACRMS